MYAIPVVSGLLVGVQGTHRGFRVRDNPVDAFLHHQLAYAEEQGHCLTLLQGPHPRGRSGAILPRCPLLSECHGHSHGGGARVHCHDGPLDSASGGRPWKFLAAGMPPVGVQRCIVHQMLPIVGPQRRANSESRALTACKAMSSSSLLG